MHKHPWIMKCHTAFAQFSSESTDWCRLTPWQPLMTKMSDLRAEHKIWAKYKYSQQFGLILPVLSPSEPGPRLSAKTNFKKSFDCFHKTNKSPKFQKSFSQSAFINVASLLYFWLYVPELRCSNFFINCFCNLFSLLKCQQF